MAEIGGFVVATATVRLPDPVPTGAGQPGFAAAIVPRQAAAPTPSAPQESRQDLASPQRRVADRTAEPGRASSRRAESPDPDGSAQDNPTALRGLFQSVAFLAQRIAQESEPRVGVRSPASVAHRVATSSYAAVQAAGRAANSASRDLDGLLDISRMLAINEVV